MKKLIFVLISLWVAGSLFQSCNNTKTYAELLEEERDAVKAFIKDSAIRVISLQEFEKDTITASKEAGDAYDEFVAFSNGVYLQIINRAIKRRKNASGMEKKSAPVIWKRMWRHAKRLVSTSFNPTGQTQIRHIRNRQFSVM